MLSVLDKATLHKMQMPLIEVLERFPSLQPTLSQVLGLLPVMKPRLYSIASSGLAAPSRVSIMVGLLEGNSPSGRLHKGVCSHFLASRKSGEYVYAAVKSTGTTFRLPPAETPVVMIGAGTGLAPFRGFLQERQELRRRNSNGVGATHLFFGCRRLEAHLIKDELDAWQKSGNIQGLTVAYSRVGEKEYVQDSIAKKESELWELLRSGAHFYVCGDAARMAPAVKAALVDVAVRKGGQARADAEVWVSEWTTGEKRYHEDVWSANA
jgi:cytochrome P450/NADPH-cytochrome P450 reductase